GGCRGDESRPGTLRGARLATPRRERRGLRSQPLLLERDASFCALERLRERAPKRGAFAAPRRRAATSGLRAPDRPHVLCPTFEASRPSHTSGCGPSRFLKAGAEALRGPNARLTLPSGRRLCRPGDEA